jgi:hypothetical protein
MKPNTGIAGNSEDLMPASFLYGLLGSIVVGLVIWAIALWLLVD